MRRLPIGVADVLGAVGLAMLGAGLWWIWPPYALVVVGTLLLVAGVLGSLGLLGGGR